MFAMFDILSFIVPIMFIVVFGIIIFSIIQGISTWHKNNNSPRLTVPAVIVAKRTDVSYHRHANAGDMSGAHGFHTTSSTTYYVTFQVESGDRMEFHVSGLEYGMLAEGDTGKLTFQGTRYLSFERYLLFGRGLRTPENIQMICLLRLIVAERQTRMKGAGPRTHDGFARYGTDDAGLLVWFSAYRGSSRCFG